MYMLKESVSKQVLTVGPDYKNNRGGIGAVIDTYHTFFAPFNFIPTYKYYASNIRKSLFYVQQCFVFVKTLGKNKEIKIIHIHGSRKGSFYRKLLFFYIAKRWYHKKVIYHIHSGAFDKFYLGSFPLQKKLIRYVLNHADATICLAPSWVPFFEENFNCKNILIVNNVVSEPAIKAQIDPAGNIPLVRLLFLGKIGDNKGIFDLLNLLVEQKAFYTGRIKLVVGGNGESEKLLGIIRDNGLENLVEYVGWAVGEKKANLFIQSHLYILPSYSEGLPVSILEAMSYGLPVISSPVGGIPDVVQDHKNGILITPGNLSEMDAAIKYFVNNPKSIYTFGQASVQQVEPYLNKAVVAQLESVYENLLNKTNND